MVRRMLNAHQPRLQIGQPAEASLQVGSCVVQRAATAVARRGQATRRKTPRYRVKIQVAHTVAAAVPCIIICFVHQNN